MAEAPPWTKARRVSGGEDGMKDLADGVCSQRLFRKPLAPCTQGERGWGEGEGLPRRPGPLTPDPSPPQRGRGEKAGTDPQTCCMERVGEAMLFRGSLVPSGPLPAPPAESV